jgi:hypothetical protein
MADSIEIAEAKHERLAAGRCCWHCRYYIRPVDSLMVDGPIGNVCTIDRQTGVYPRSDELNPGDKFMAPDDVCQRFEMSLPPAESAWPTHLR